MLLEKARESLGMEPITGGDDVFIPANLFPLGEPQESPLDKEPPKPEEEGKNAYGLIDNTEPKTKKNKK